MKPIQWSSILLSLTKLLFVNIFFLTFPLSFDTSSSFFASIFANESKYSSYIDLYKPAFFAYLIFIGSQLSLSRFETGRTPPISRLVIIYLFLYLTNGIYVLFHKFDFNLNCLPDQPTTENFIKPVYQLEKWIYSSTVAVVRLFSFDIEYFNFKDACHHPQPFEVFFLQLLFVITPFFYGITCGQVIDSNQNAVSYIKGLSKKNGTKRNIIFVYLAIIALTVLYCFVLLSIYSPIRFGFHFTFLVLLALGIYFQGKHQSMTIKTVLVLFQAVIISHGAIFAVVSAFNWGLVVDFIHVKEKLNLLENEEAASG